MSEPDSKPLEYESRIKPKTPPADGADYACPKCDGDMIAGYCTSATRDGSQQLMWSKGVPEMVKLFGFIPMLVLNMKNVPTFPVTTYACNRCGYVESFLR